MIKYMVDIRHNVASECEQVIHVQSELYVSKTLLLST